MSQKVELHYRTFDELMDAVSLDFSTYSIENLIDPANLIKIAQLCTYNLGLRIYKTKTRMIEIHHRKAKLPSDFYVMNHALYCHSYKVTSTVPSGRHIEDVLTSDIVIDSCCDTCKEPLTDCSCVETTTCPAPTCPSLCDDYTVVEVVRTEVRTYQEVYPINFKPYRTSKHCPNTRYQCGKHGEIKDGYIYFDFDHGSLYLSYEGTLEDDEGNLLVLDHPMINEYYEWAIKEKILQNLYFSGEPVEQKLSLAKQELRDAKNNAISVVTTPDFQEMRAVHDLNRQYMYQKYYKMFESC